MMLDDGVTHREPDTQSPQSPSIWAARGRRTVRGAGSGHPLAKDPATGAGRPGARPVVDGESPHPRAGHRPRGPRSL